MPTGWQTFASECRGGLVTNISPLQQGINATSTARRLVNFEPSIEGGYRRILGYTKFDTAYVPPYGDPKVQGSGQSGSTLVIANIYTAPQPGDTFTVAGVSGTYTIAAGGVTFSGTNKTATLTLTTSLATSPADKAAVTFSNNNTLIEGLIYFQGNAIAYRGSDLYKSSGTGWTKINVPSYGTVLVDGGSQTGTSLDVDGLNSVPQIGDTFSINGVEKVYTVTAAPTLTGDAATLTIAPALDSSPADNAVITFLSTDRSGGGKHRFARYNYTGASTIIGVDRVNAPFKYDNTTFTVFDDAPGDVLSAEHVVEYKSHIFYGKDNTLSFTAPFNEADFTAASGAGTILIPHNITGLIVFREQLIVFSTSKIYRIVGNTIADFTLQPIALDVGCIHEDTIQEVGGDIVFVAADGIRMLSATDRFGDFGLAVASRVIQAETKTFMDQHTDFCSAVIREKNQYRLFGFTTTISEASARGIMGVQFADQSAQSMAWAELRGFKAYVADSFFTAANGEVSIFANNSGYVYLMETGNSLDGKNINASFSTPFFSITDPRIRKTIYKLHTYIDPKGSVSGSASLRFDFDQANKIQPQSVTLENTTSQAAFYGEAIYGVATYGGKPVTEFINQVVGSGFTVSVEYTFNGTTPPFSLDSVILEYATHDRQ